MARLYSSDEARKLAGISYRQLDYWVREGVVKPEQASIGRGTARRWSAIQVVELRVIAGMRRAGGASRGDGAATGVLAHSRPVKRPASIGLRGMAALQWQEASSCRTGGDGGGHNIPAGLP